MLTEIEFRGRASMDVFRRLRHLRHVVFLDSARFHPAHGRFSFLAADPLLTITARNHAIEIGGPAGRRSMEGNPWEIFESLLTRFRLPPLKNDLQLPLGAAIGYFGYDLNRHLECLASPPAAPLPAPDLWFGFYDSLFAFDHQERRAWLVTSGLDENGVPCAARAAFRRDQLLDELQSDPAIVFPPAALSKTIGPLRSKTDHESAVRKALGYIRRGDVYQVNLAHPFSGTARDSAFDLYLQLRENNPAPFGAYLDFGPGQILSSSPERFLRMERREIQARPIKGTCPRVGDSRTDWAQANALMRSAKNKAELLMITDLLRNDLGKVAEYGSVAVPHLAQCEEYETVFHLVSTVTARLRPHLFHLDTLMACFPGGSITGAPKVRAMEIIHELEPWGRGIYTGALGYFGFNGVSDFNILIRTLLYQQGHVCFHVGGGIVVDSDPSLEYEETIHKARALLGLWQPAVLKVSRASA